ncbi:MAG: putative lipid II flippase FtsW [Rhodospirillales bacterium]|jgi:cell division protein FtsW|nr:putative lipid II flippase FtsW [Rhodospirillales bacterium]
MNALARTDTSLLGRWWWTVDRWTLTALFFIAAFGAVLTMAASPPVAERMGLETFYFARRQFVFLALGFVVMISTSLLAPRGIRRLAMASFAVALVLLAAVPFLGEEINGATRWIRAGGLSVQPSEFVKPSFVIVAAWLFAQRRLDERFPGYAVATGLMVLVVGLLLAQPDVGMTVVVVAVWSLQFFVAGLPMAWVALIAALFVGGGVAAYFAFSHVQARVDRFLDPTAGESYQVGRALEAFREGGMFGRGPGEGRVKDVLPDAHADFIFAVAGEEFGLFVCLAIVGLFAFVVLRGLIRVLREDDLFILLAVGGLLAQFGLQTVINMATTIRLMPPKGMTLPFISYGGSSTLALAFAMGAVLALTRERPGRMP